MKRSSAVRETPSLSLQVWLINFKTPDTEALTLSFFVRPAMVNSCSRSSSTILN